MSDSEVCMVFHFDGELNLKLGNPVYNGGDQKMTFVSGCITYSSLVEKVLEATNWVMHDEYPYMQYLYHNGLAFTLVSLKGDDDLRTMFKAFQHGTDAIYLYVRKTSENAARDQAQSRPHVYQRCGDGDNTFGSRSKHHDSRVDADVNVRPPYQSRVLRRRSSLTCASASNTSIGVEDQAAPSRSGGNRFNVSNISSIHVDLNTSESYNAPQMERRCADVASVNLRDVADSVALVVVSEHEGDEGGSEGEVDDKVDDAHMGEVLLDDRWLPVDASTSPVPEGEEPSNADKDGSIVDTLVPDSDQIGDDDRDISSRDLWKGRQFPDRDSFRITMNKFAMYNNFSLKHIKTNVKSVTARCEAPNCPWRIHASIINYGPQFQVRTYNPNHTCSRPMMGLAERHATSELVAGFIKQRLRLYPMYTPKEIISDFQSEFGIAISYRKAWRAKEKALRDIRQSGWKVLPSETRGLRGRPRKNSIPTVMTE